MKILIAGSAGFIGSASSLRRLERGDQVIGGDTLNGDYDVSQKEAKVPGIYQAGILAVPHREFVAAVVDIRALGAENSALPDVTSMLPNQAGAMRL